MVKYWQNDIYEHIRIGEQMKNGQIEKCYLVIRSKMDNILNVYGIMFL